MLAASDVHAIGATSAFRERGLGVPSDIAMVSIDGTQAAAYAIPPLTTVAQAIRDMRDAAVEDLIERPAEVIHWNVENELVIRESCGCRGSAPSTAAP